MEQASVAFSVWGYAMHKKGDHLIACMVPVGGVK